MWTPIKSPSFNIWIDKTPFPNNLNTSPDRTNIDLPDYLEECSTIDWIANNKNLPNTILYSSIKNEEFDRTMTLLVFPDEEEFETNEWEEPSF